MTGPGKNNPALNKFLRKIRLKTGLKTGTILNTAEYEHAKQRFFDIAQKQGYLKGFFIKHAIKINKHNNTAVITLHFNTGPRYYFGKVYFAKNPFSTAFLRRFIPFKTGHPYSTARLLELQTNLSSTIYFSRVDIEPQITEAKNYHVPVNVQLIPKKAKQYSLGIGYGTDTGARGSVGWEWRRVTKTGHYFQTLLQVSRQGNNLLQARYVIPGKNPVTDHYYINAGVFTGEPGDNDDKYTTRQVGVSAVTIQRGWQRTISLQFQHETFTVNHIDRKSSILLPGVSWERIRAHNRIRTRNGYRLFFNAELGVATQSDASFLQLEFQGKYIHSFDQQKNRIILRTDLGITAVKNFDDMPLSHRFYAGGSQSIRGFDYQELGSGRYLIVGSAEYQRQLHGNFYSALFYDVGNAIRKLPLRLKQSVGVGLVYRSPIGPIAITVAHPLDQGLKLSLNSLKIQFTMGPDL